MSYRSFWLRRLILAASIPASTAPSFKHSPFASSAFIGEPIGVIDGVLWSNTTGVITTDIVKLDGSIVPTSYVIQDGDQLRIRQIATNSAGVDIHFSGWVLAQQKITGYTPLAPVMRSTAVALTDAAQPGSRLHYVSKSAGYDPALADFYFLTPSGLVDSSGSLTGAGGVPYGTDWRNPSGPIKPYRHMSACLPTNNGLNPGVRTGGPGLGQATYSAPASSRNRFEKPDMWLFLRGDTFNLDSDLSDYQTFCPTFTPISGPCVLGTPGGADANNLRVMCDYGPTSSPRPRFIQPRNRGGSVPSNTKYAFISGLEKNTRYVGLHFDGRTLDAGYTGQLNLVNVGNLAATCRNNGFEDCWADGFGIGDPVGGYSQCYFYRCVITDCWSTTLNFGHIAGIHSTVADPGILQLVDCRFARNGYIGVDPALVEGGTYTPPAHNPASTYTRDTLVVSGGEWYVLNATSVAAGTAITNSAWVKVTDQGGRRALASIYDRNLYLSGRTDMDDCVILRGGSNEQWRSGGFVRRNFIQAGGIVVSDWQQPSENENQTAGVFWNVIQNVNQSGVHTSTPIQVQLGCHFSLVEYNACTFAQEGASTATAIYMASRQETYDVNATSITNRTRGNVIRKNLLHSGAGYSMRLVDGIWGGMYQGSYTMNPDAGFAVFPSLTENRVDDNDFIGTSMAQQYTSLPADAPLAPLTTDTVLAGSTTWNTRAAYAAAKGGADSERTLKTYLQSLGITVNSIDGVHEAVAIFKTMDRNNWPTQYSAKSINNYIRAGLGLPIQA